MHNVIIFLFKPVLNRALRRQLSVAYPRPEVRSIIKAVWARYRKLKHLVAIQPTLGGRIMVRLAAASEACYRELLQREPEEAKVIEHFNHVGWDVYSKMGKVAWRVAGLRKRSPYERLRRSIMAFRTFPFNPPSYRWRDLPGGTGEVVFNCERCPVAEYFKHRGIAQFGFSTWCQYDFRLAELWGGHLSLTNTIAGGATYCDFRWKVDERLESRSKKSTK